jgi:YHS domain-containing protein
MKYVCCVCHKAVDNAFATDNKYYFCSEKCYRQEHHPDLYNELRGNNSAYNPKRF